MDFFNFMNFNMWIIITISGNEVELLGIITVIRDCDAPIWSLDTVTVKGKPITKRLSGMYSVMSGKT